jgi:hypothetical protein
MKGEGTRGLLVIIVVGNVMVGIVGLVVGEVEVVFADELYHVIDLPVDFAEKTYLLL